MEDVLLQAQAWYIQIGGLLFSLACVLYYIGLLFSM